MMVIAFLTASLTGTALLGTPNTAQADNGPGTAISDRTYESDADVFETMGKWTPLRGSESVMGYPRGLDRDRSGSINAVALADVRRTYDPEQAIRDAENAALRYAGDKRNPEALRASARKLVDGWPEGSRSASHDIRQNTKDDTLPSAALSAEEYCGMVNSDPAHPAYGQTAPCVFVGKLDEKYPVRGASDAMAGEGKLTYKISASVTDERSVTEGWSAGGKIAPKLISKDQADIGAEASFSYSYTSTSVSRVQNTLETAAEITVPKNKRGYLEGRANGAYYTGYVVLRDIDGSNQESIVAIPARVYIQAPHSSTPLTWFKRLSDS
ncbi:hypothetical protein ACFCYM_35090 [Streptomyces sp. NPDC056254]|uniref:hypothetical protein n=1 Tax=Streptomyces sp. NPDC056254 TaxID=3345763 RepID=UPI0035DAAE6D